MARLAAVGIVLHCACCCAGETLKARPPVSQDEDASFWRGLVIAAAVASIPPAIQEVRESGRLADASAGLMLAVPLVAGMGVWSCGIFLVETHSILWPGTRWTPSLGSFCAIFGLWGAALGWLSVVSEIKIGALLMIAFAWMYFH